VEKMKMRMQEGGRRGESQSGKKNAIGWVWKKVHMAMAPIKGDLHPEK